MRGINREQQIDNAFGLFSQAVVESAEFAMAYYKRGLCYMMMNDYKRALYDFSAAILNETRYPHKQPSQSQVKGDGLAAFYSKWNRFVYVLKIWILDS